MASNEERRLRLELVAVAAKVAQRGLIFAGEGNLSVRCGDGYLVTPTGADKGRLTAASLLYAEPGRTFPDGASSEIRMHDAVYRRLPEVRAIVHTHPPEALCLSTRGVPPDARLTAEGGMLLGRVEWVGFFDPGSWELAQGVAEALARAPACVLDRHGAVTVGPDLHTAFRRTLLLERVALLSRADAGAR